MTSMKNHPNWGLENKGTNMLTYGQMAGKSKQVYFLKAKRDMITVCSYLSHVNEQWKLVGSPEPRQLRGGGELDTSKLHGDLEAARVHVVVVLHPSWSRPLQFTIIVLVKIQKISFLFLL